MSTMLHDLRLALAFALVLALVLAAGCAPSAEAPSGPLARDIETARASGRERFAHDGWHALVARHVKDGLVDYRGFGKDVGELDAYLGRLATAKLPALSEPELEALLINAYNALTVRSILAFPHVKSIRDIPGVWDKRRHVVGGHTLTLDELEHRILRPVFKDPRIHFAINCASRSCAALAAEAFTGAHLDAQLAAREKVFMEDPKQVRFEGGRLYLSSYFSWFRDDFTKEGVRGGHPTVPEYVAAHAKADVTAAIRTLQMKPPLSYNGYDWSLNQAVPPDPATPAPPLTGPALASADAPSAVGGGDGIAGRLRAWTASFGPAAPVVYAFVYAVAVACLVPGSALTLGAGAAFGFGVAYITVTVGSLLGASIAFWLARTLLRSRAKKMIESRPTLVGIDRALEREGAKLLALMRLSPLVPFTILNYVCGLTGLPFSTYLVTSWLAMIPGTMLYTWAGATAVDLSQGGSTGSTALKLVGLAATALAVWYAGRVAKREVERATAESQRPADAPTG